VSRVGHQAPSPDRTPAGRGNVPNLQERSAIARKLCVLATRIRIGAMAFLIRSTGFRAACEGLGNIPATRTCAQADPISRALTPRHHRHQRRIRQFAAVCFFFFVFEQELTQDARQAI